MGGGSEQWVLQRRLLRVEGGVAPAAFSGRGVTAAATRGGWSGACCAQWQRRNGGCYARRVEWRLLRLVAEAQQRLLRVEGEVSTTTMGGGSE